MSLEAIYKAIPHREPFLLVDEIVSQEESHIVCRKTFSGDEFWFAGHYPEYPLVPGVILCEAAMQAGAILLAQFASDDSGIPVVTKLSDVRFRKMVRPGDSIEMDIHLDERVQKAFFLSGKVTVDDAVAVRLQFACTLAQPQ